MFGSEIGPTYFSLTYFFPEGTYMSAFMTCNLEMDPPPPSPSTPVLHCWLPEHIRSFDRLPYGCLLFLYLDLT